MAETAVPNALEGVPSPSESLAPRRPRVTAPAIAARKGGDAPIVMVTAYDAPSARICDAAGVDVILVGDSLANVVLGYDDTLQVTIADMEHHVGAVARTVHARWSSATCRG